MRGQDRTLVTTLDAAGAPGLKGPWREFEALHHVAESESLKRAPSWRSVKVQWRPQHLGAMPVPWDGH